ncbi:putative tetratricopeptide-like helical domain superfamily, DYW domain-containing protein [Helianthus annuus]|nr:putative tetratricopeptide-like helical domain superfamily, DYW domain-containing protein [Helianthus annuus]
MGFFKTMTEPQTQQKQLALSLLKTPQSIKCPKHLRSIHVILLRTALHRSSYAVGNFITSCANLGLMNYAHQMFDQMPEPNSFVWNTLIRGFQQNHEPRKVMDFYDRMWSERVGPDCFTYPFVIRACTELSEHVRGKCVHGLLFKVGLELDMFIGTSLIEFYGGFGDANAARRVFDELPVKDKVAWTVLLSSCVDKCSDLEAARKVFDEMPGKDLVVWNIMIFQYVKAGDVRNAYELFTLAPVKDLLMYNTVLGGYARHGEVDIMINFFHDMPAKDLVSWNTVIGGLVRDNRIKEAMNCFQQMLSENISPNEITLVSLLSACAQVGALDTGRWLHSYIDRNNRGLNVVVATGLVDMYSKCGDLESADYVFNKLQNPDVVAWNAMIMGFSMNGQSKKTLKLFTRMKSGSVMPNEVTILGVLCACVHAGFVNDGRELFNSMVKDLGLAPKVEHYGCMVDLLGRAGLLDEAYELIQSMPMEPHTGVWGALLGACKLHKNVELAETAIKHLNELEHEDGGYLTMMSNIYANAGRWDDVARTRQLMRTKGVDKLRGCSSIEVNGEIHEFGAEDKVHPRLKEIHEMIDEILSRLRLAGHVASRNEVLFDVEDEEKDKALLYHSEKMAVAFGLIATTKGTVIRVVKNLRICGDCHAVMKLVSETFEREIVIRDRSRFHHFKNGRCSCGDYW